MQMLDGLNSPIPGHLHTKFLGEKHDATGTPVGPYLHGSGGLFNVPEAGDGIMNLMTMPMPGALSTIPVLARDPVQPDLPEEVGGRDVEYQTVLSGVTQGALADFNNQPTAVCVDGPVGGLMKIGTFINTRARYTGSTREVEIERAGTAMDKLDPFALRLLNMPGPFKELFSVPQNVPSGGAVIMNELASRLYESFVDFVRMIAPRVYIGSPVNNSGQRRDMVGLDLHINTGTHIDAFSMNPVTSADSVIIDFGFNDIEDDVMDIVERLEECDYQAIDWNASRQGLGAVSGWIFMRPELWRKITQVWPIRQYWAAFRSIAEMTNGRVMVNATDTTQQRKEMMSSQILPLNGRNYLVILDDTIPEFNVTTKTGLLAGQYASDVWFVPATIMGSMPATYFTYFNHANANSESIARLAGNFMTFTTDNGMFRWNVSFTKGCLKLGFKMNPQLKCLASSVAWRLTNVKYRPLMKSRDYNPSSPYHKDGGSTTSTRNPQFYSGWSPTSPGNI